MSTATPLQPRRLRRHWPVLLGLALGLIECLALARSGLLDRLQRRRSCPPGVTGA